MSIDKRQGFDWKCEAQGCESVVTKSSDRVPPSDFVAVHIHRGDVAASNVVGHACSEACAGLLAQELYREIMKYADAMAPMPEVEEIQDPEGLQTQA